MIHLIIGGARSGKSRLAENYVQQIVNEKGKSPCYLATATPSDAEMVERILQHQLQRENANIGLKKAWRLHESPLSLAEACLQFQSDDIVLIDCLTLWLNNQLQRALEHTNYTEVEVNCEVSSKAISEAFFQYEQISKEIAQAKATLLAALNQVACDLVIVSNEVGQGVIPMGRLTRLFVDQAGWLNQAVAELADKVTLVTAGLPMVLKDNTNNTNNRNN